MYLRGGLTPAKGEEHSQPPSECTSWHMASMKSQLVRVKGRGRGRVRVRVRARVRVRVRVRVSAQLRRVVAEGARRVQELGGVPGEG